MSEPPAISSELTPTAIADVQPSAAQSEVVAPADLVPQPRWWERLAWYTGAILLSCLLTTIGMKLWDRDLRAPFYYDLDALLYLPLTRTVIDQGFWNYWHVDRLGAPGGQLLYDFPIIDYLHFFFLWLLGQIFSNMLVAYNLYSLLTYPLTALTGMWVLRWLRLSLPTAALGGLLYAFLPYHQERYHYHYFLAAYWWVPVSLVPAIALCRGHFPFFRRGPDGQYTPLEIDWAKVRVTTTGAIRASGAAWKTILSWTLQGSLWLMRNLMTRRALGPIAIGFVTASAGAYYAFFACAAYAFAGVYSLIVYRTWRGLVSGALVIAPVFVTGFLYHVPTLLYHHEYGNNPITVRQAHEAESYGLKVAHLLLPTNDHNFTPFANLRARYANPARPADGESAGSLGIIGGIGLVGLTGLVLLPFRRRWPEGPIAALAVYLVLLGSIGALGSLFNLIVSPQIRAYNRISVFIAFLAFFAVLWWVDRYLLTRTGRIMQRLRYPVLAGMLILGYFDQTPWGWSPFNSHGMDPIDVFAERFRSDKQFFQQIEKSMPPGAKIFCLPYSAFPESPPVQKMPAYEHARGYIMTDTLKWSFGAIKKREADVWQKDVSFMMSREREQERMLKRIVAAGFDGVLIDGRGFPARDVDRAAALIKRFNDSFQTLTGPMGGKLPQVKHEDGKQFFLDLRPYREAWRERMPAQYAAMETFEREWVTPQWLAGFLVTDPADDGEWYVWGQPDTTMWLLNPTDRTRTFTMSFTIGVEGPGEFEMTFSGLISPPSFTLVSKPAKDEHDTNRYGTPKTFTFDLPPGRSAIRIRCKLPPYFMSDERMLCYFLKDFKLVEEGSPPKQ